MKVLINKKDKHHMLLVGETEGDIEALRTLFYNHVCWGFHTIWYKTPENKGMDQPLYKMLKEKFGDITCYGEFHSPEDFVSSYDKEDKATETKYLKKPEAKVDSDSLFNDLIEEGE